VDWQSTFLQLRTRVELPVTLCNVGVEKSFMMIVRRSCKEIYLTMRTYMKVSEIVFVFDEHDVVLTFVGTAETVEVFRWSRRIWRSNSILEYDRRSRIIVRELRLKLE
jgi:hypothetical protein